MAEVPGADLAPPKEILGELDLLEKELRKAGAKLDKANLVLRRQGEEADSAWVVLLKDPKELVLPRPAIKREHIESLEWLGPQRKAYSTSRRSLQQLLSAEANPFVRELLECTLLAKSINTVYRSCHGEVDEATFFSLALGHDAQLWAMLADPSVRLHPRGVLFRLFELYSGVAFDFDERAFDGGRLSVRELRVRERGYEFARLELVDIAGSYDRYVKDGRLELAAESVLLRTELEDGGKAALVLDHADLLTLQAKHQESLEELQQISDQVRPFTLERLRLLTLLAKDHSFLGNESELLLAFENLLIELTFTFGTDTPLHSTLYSILGHFYSTRADRLAESTNLYHLSLGIVRKLYGEASLEAGDGLVDIAQAYMRAGRWEDASFSAEQAELCYKDSKRKMAEAIALKSKISWRKGDAREANDKLDRAIKVYGKLGRPVELFELYKLKLTYDSDPASRSVIAD